MEQTGERLPRRRRRALSYLLVLTIVGAGLAVVAAGHEKAGSLFIAVALLLGALLRLVLPEGEAGQLAARRRLVDAVLLGGLGLVLAVAALIVEMPNFLGRGG